MYQLGRAYASSGQMTEAIAAWRKAADKGSSSAMVELGVAYGTGTGVARDEAQARKLFERAAEAGNPRGVSNLAALGGGGAPADPARSRELLGRAAETNAEAQYQLGIMLSEGNGGAKDDAGARAMFEKAAAQNHPAALERMGAFAAEGRGGPKDATAAKAYYERAAALGDEDAKKALEKSRCPYVDQGQARQCGDRALLLSLRATLVVIGDVVIRKLKSGEYRLYSRKVNPKTGKRRNLGTFRTRAAAEKHEREVQYFKRH